MIPLSQVILSPWWISLPVAAIAMLVISAHIDVTSMVTKPPSRRRIRLANGWVMLCTVPLLAIGLSFVDPEIRPRAFALVWTAGILLVAVSLALAALDILNTVRIAHRSRAKLKVALQELIGEIERATAEASTESIRAVSDGARGDAEPG